MPGAELGRREFLGAGLAFLAAPPGADELAGLTLREAAARVRQKSVSPVELTRACLQRIERYQPVLNAFITITGESALAEARALETEAQRGSFRGPLHGVPIALKDNVDTAGIRTTGASALFADRVPTEDAEVARRLKAAGAVMLGKLNLHEFAYGGTTVVSYFGATKNPWQTNHNPGGSSGGSGAAVAARLCYGAIGTDTGGSIRIPAAYCGIAGLKATYGRVSNRGIIPLSFTLDHAGPMCRTAGDCAAMLQALAGYDPADSTTVDTPVPDYLAAMQAKVSSLRLGLPRALFFDKLDPEIAKAVAGAIEALRKLTASARDVILPAVADLPTVGGPETYSYHSTWFPRSQSLYQPATRKRLERAGAITAGTYVQARREVDRVRRQVRNVFSSVDLLVTPTMKLLPYTIEEARKRDNEEIVPDVLLSNTGPFNIYGLPVISIPCGFSASGLPIGLQIAGPPWGEGAVLSLAHAYEQATEWHKRQPQLQPQL